MATLYIAEFTSQVVDNGKHIAPAALQPTVAAPQTVALSSTSAQSAALNAFTTLVRVQTDTACFILFGTNPTALTTSIPLSAGVPEYFGVPQGGTLKIAARTA